MNNEKIAGTLLNLAKALISSDDWNKNVKSKTEKDWKQAILMPNNSAYVGKRKGMNGTTDIYIFKADSIPTAKRVEGHVRNMVKGVKKDVVMKSGKGDSYEIYIKLRD